MNFSPAALNAVTTTPQGSDAAPIHAHAPNDVPTATIPTPDPSIVDYVIEGIADLDDGSRRHMIAFYKALLPKMKKKADNSPFFSRINIVRL